MLGQIEKLENSQDLTLRVEDGNSELSELADRYNSLLSKVETIQASQVETQQSQERLATAIAGANDGLWDWDVQTGKVWYAPKFKELLSYDDYESEFADTIDSFKDHLHRDDRQAIWEAISRHINKDIDDNEKLDVEARVRRRRGSYRWFRIRAAGVQDPTGKVVRMSGSITDVTERKKFEEALKQSNYDLEQFAVIASHDLQEPLRKVASFCGLLQQEYSQQLDDEGRKYLDFAIDGASRMSTLVQDLLRYSKIGSEVSLDQSTDSEAALKLAIANLGGAIADSQAEVTFDSLPALIAEPREISQLFQNLIGNAIKYRSEAPPKIHISVENNEEFWQFSIADNGIGIEPEFRDCVFRIFQRLHSRSEHSGTGVGLAICKRVIDQLGGTIWVESNSTSDSGQGSTFCFTVPKKISSIYDSIRSDNNYEYV
ncbi:ATP-binding protein [Mariniblastus sp.]|nr:ATP-binding protein [Mariniblastus sp.]